MYKKMGWQAAVPALLLAVSLVATVAVLVLRASLMPALYDDVTGRLAANTPAVAVLLGTLLLLAVGVLFLPRERVDIRTGSLPVALACMLAGVLVALPSGYNLVLWMLGGLQPVSTQAVAGPLTGAVMVAMQVCGAVGGVALVCLGWRITAAGGTRAGMSGFGALVPVLWAWLRLAWYELSYAAAVGWSEKLYDFVMVIAQLLFLFQLARLVSGVGKAPLRLLLPLALATAVTALSGSLLRVILFFAGDATVYAAGALAGLADAGVGLMALACAVALVRNYEP